MADVLRRGYATSATDDVHTGQGANFIAGHSEKFVDFAYRAEFSTPAGVAVTVEAGHRQVYRVASGQSGDIKIEPSAF